MIETVPYELIVALAAEAPVIAMSPPSSGVSEEIAANGGFTSRLMVESWLADQGQQFRVKAQPDNNGRKVYILAQCPFDSAHGDPDSCIMQDPNGKMSAQCFHNSCRGRGWKAFKEAIGAPKRHHYDPPLPGRKRPWKLRLAGENASTNGKHDDYSVGNDSNPSDLPWIQGNKRQLREITADALAALRAGNNPPKIFQRGGLLTRIRAREDNGAPFLEPLGEAALRGVLARVANWEKIINKKGGPVEEDDSPPICVVNDLANLPGWEGIPVIEAVVECPVFTRTGERIDTPGFHPSARLWYHPAPGLEIPPISERPTPEEVEQARDLLLIELLGDFPFKDEASKAHALGALLLPFVRPLIDGPTPLHLLDAPTEGTGKTLLATIIALVGTGRDAEAIAEGSCDEEWRKRITALLTDGPTFVLLDNISRVLESGALASVLTSRTWKDRILGFTKTATLPNTCVWLATGNNTRLSREITRRTLFCRLDAKVDAPWERKGFRHPKLILWAKENRGLLVWAALTLCQAWSAQGRPAGSQHLGMFESWAEVIGGILEISGVPGLLANAKEFRATHADLVSEWRAFVASWWQELGDRKVGVQELFHLATQQNLLDSVLGDKGEKSQRTRLGKAMAKAAERVFGEYRIEIADEDHKGRQQYRLLQLPNARVEPSKEVQ